MFGNENTYQWKSYYHYIDDNSFKTKYYLLTIKCTLCNEAFLVITGRVPLDLHLAVLHAVAEDSGVAGVSNEEEGTSALTLVERHGIRFRYLRVQSPDGRRFASVHCEIIRRFLQDVDEAKNLVARRLFPSLEETFFWPNVGSLAWSPLGQLHVVQCLKRPHIFCLSAVWWSQFWMRMILI